MPGLEATSMNGVPKGPGRPGAGRKGCSVGIATGVLAIGDGAGAAGGSK